MILITNEFSAVILKEVSVIFSKVEQQLISEMEQMEVIDAHEHLYPEKMRNQMPVDVSSLFSNYSDIGIAGMTSEDAGIFTNMELPMAERWKRVTPYWDRARWTSYSRNLLLSIKKHYDADDLTEKTVVEISERMAAENKPGLYQRMLREDCNIRTALTQCNRTDVGPLLTPVMSLMPHVATWEQVSCPKIESWDGSIVVLDPTITVHTLDDLLEANKSYIKRMKAEGVVGLKTGANPCQDPDRTTAEQCFADLKNGSVPSLPFYNPLWDYIEDEMIKFAGEQNLTVAVHTGYWGDFRQLDPLHMLPTVANNPGTRFDFYHLGFPWTRESLTIAKNYGNVWINFCWTQIISQKIATDTLDEAIDLLPTNKIIGFGADFVVPVEMVYGHMVMARENIARALARRIEADQMGMDDAVNISRMWLFDNAKELYKLEI